MKKITKEQKSYLCMVGLLLLPSMMRAESRFQVSPLFSSHMVIQRDKPVPVWGLAHPKDEITVMFDGQKKITKADAQGKWSVTLDPMKANAEGRDLLVLSEQELGTAKITDVLVGDVWLCSGQSNMYFPIKNVENAAQEMASMKHPSVRFFSLKQNFSQKVSDKIVGEWKPVAPENVPTFSAVACFFGTSLHAKTGVPVGLLVSTIGGTPIETWMKSETLRKLKVAETLSDKWKRFSPEEFQSISRAYSIFQTQRDQEYPKAVQLAKAQGKPIPPAPVAPQNRCHDCPSALHNGMIAPLQPFAIRGVVWYQGESNVNQPNLYQKLLPAMIEDWRQVWGAELPFLFVQLAPHRLTHPSFLEAQQRIWQSTPHTAMVVTTDVGDLDNMHPIRKRPVGERLALAARALSYGESVEYSGPIFLSMKLVGSSAVIKFKHVGGGLMAKDGELKGFAMIGSDGKPVPARAVIENSTVVVTSDLPNPVAVRYNWTLKPEGNLYSVEGLPAATFRSDPPKNVE